VDDLAERFARAERQGLIDIVRSCADMPMSELLSLVESGRIGRLLGSLTVAECQAGLADRGRAVELDEATEQQSKASLRANYDGRILDALRETIEPLSPSQVCELVGGSAHEARVALQRLAAAKKVTRVWKSGGQHGYSAA
jgi:hypothetical protein